MKKSQCNRATKAFYFEITYDDFRKNENARLDMINYCKLEMDDKKCKSQKLDPLVKEFATFFYTRN